MANVLDLLNERREILQALSHDEQSLLVPDPHVKNRLALILAGAGERKGDRAGRKVFDELKELYGTYGASTVRTLLDYSYLLYRNIDITDIIKPFVDIVIAGAVDDARLVDAFIHEIERYSSSPFWPTRDVVKVLINGLAKKPGVASRLLNNDRLNFETARFVVDLIVKKKLTDEYPAVVAFTERVCRRNDPQAFASRIQPLGESVAKMGRAGLELLAPVFETRGLGKHGHTVIAGFGCEFCRWFLDSPPKPSRRWARAAFMVSLTAEQQYKSKMLSLLLNKWCSDGAIAELVRELMEDERDAHRAFLNSFSPQVRADAEEFLGDSRKPLKADDVLEAARGNAGQWGDFAARMLIRRRDGEAAAGAFANGEDFTRARIVKTINQRRGRFVSGFFDRAKRAPFFLGLPVSAQMQILKSRHYRDHADLRQLREILQAKARLDGAVYRRVLEEAERLGLRDVDVERNDSDEVLR